MAKDKQNKNKVVKSYYQKNWWKYGLYWGGFMYVIMVFGFPYYQDKEITLLSMILGIPIWVIGGLVYGYLMKWYYKWASSAK